MTAIVQICKIISVGISKEIARDMSIRTILREIHKQFTKKIFKVPTRKIWRYMNFQKDCRWNSKRGCQKKKKNTEINPTKDVKAIAGSFSLEITDTIEKKNADEISKKYNSRISKFFKWILKQILKNFQKNVEKSFKENQIDVVEEIPGEIWVEILKEVPKKCPPKHYLQFSKKLWIPKEIVQ